jgi:hypothetical protein
MEHPFDIESRISNDPSGLSYYSLNHCRYIGTETVHTIYIHNDTHTHTHTHIFVYARYK